MDVADDRILTQSDETQTDISFEEIMRTKAIETVGDVSNNEIEPNGEQIAENPQAIETNDITDMAPSTSSAIEMPESFEFDRKEFLNASTDSSSCSITLSIAEGFKEFSVSPSGLPYLLQDRNNFGDDVSHCNIQFSNETTNDMSTIPDEEGLQVENIESSISNEELPMLAPGFVKNAAKFWEDKLSGTRRKTPVLGSNL